MDEILIEDKKYVSSKRAAKITGYAKDYVGQLCREGRVPARLVGRSWYVLETAIQDHRFGDQESEPAKEAQPIPKQSLQSTWESPRYEASDEDLLPSINRLADVKEDQEPHERHIQDSWREWFDKFETPESPVEASEVIPEGVEHPVEQRDPVDEKEEETEEIPIPIHVYQPPPEEFLPRHEVSAKQEAHIQHRRKNSRVSPLFQVAGVIVAMLAVSLAVVGSGYLDTYIISNSQVSLIAGVALYNK